VPDLPLKLRLLVRTDTESVRGDMLLPMQKPQADSRILAPNDIRSLRAPFLAILLSTCREPGAMPKETPSCSLLPFTIAATVMRST